MRERTNPSVVCQPVTAGAPVCSRPMIAVTHDRFAGRAEPTCTPSSCLSKVLQDNLRLTRAFEARLTHIVLGLRGDWLAGPAARWPSICSQNELAVTDIEKRVATAIRKSFFCFSQFLCGLEVLLLEIQQLGVVCEEALLSIEKLFVHRHHHFGQLVGITDADGSLADIDGNAKSANRARNESHVHESSFCNRSVRERADRMRGCELPPDMSATAAPRALISISPRGTRDVESFRSLVRMWLRPSSSHAPQPAFLLLGRLQIAAMAGGMLTESAHLWGA